MSHKQNDIYRESVAEAQEERVCSDCGGTGETIATQAGFNSQTGEIESETYQKCICQYKVESDDNVPELD